MNRREFVRHFLALGLMTPSLNAAAINLITLQPEKVEAVGETQLIPEFEYEDAVIKVIGVGSAGCNALNMMIEQGVYSAEYIAIDSDAQTLESSKAATHLKIGASEDSRGADRAQISQLLKGAHMLFIVAGMGGETGTAVAALVGEIALEMNILTIAVVTSPAGSEEVLVTSVAEEIVVLRENVDTLIVVPIDDLMRIHGVAMPEAFKIANGVMKDAVAGIAEMVNAPGLIGVDFADVCTIMSENGSAMMGVGLAAGPDRARRAAESAIASPLINNASNAPGVLVNITSSSSIKVKELENVMGCVQFASEEATVILGNVFDEAMGDELRVTIVVTGLGDRKSKPELVYADEEAKRTGTYDIPVSSVNYGELDTPTIMRSGRRAAVDAMGKSGVNAYEIPSFLRSQSGRS